MTQSAGKNAVVALAQRLHQVGQRKHHRHGVVLSGDSDWAWRTAQDLCEPLDSGNMVLVSDADHSPLPAGANCQSVGIDQCRNLLGSEYNAVIYDCHVGFEADSVGAIAGTVRAGGLLILLAPALEHWPENHDPDFARRIPDGLSPPPYSRYVGRLADRIRASQHCILIQQHGKLPPLPELPDSQYRPDHAVGSDQSAAVEAVKKVVTGQRRRPVVLLADRGRGKSAALGLAAGDLLGGGLNRIGVCGLNRKSVANVFRHAGAGVGVDTDDPALKFIPADMLLKKKADIELLLVDEAATLPVPVLTQILKTYPRIAFASTVHGYEGTGRGFITHFASILDQHTRGWKKCRLHQPIRWAEHDPLEQFLFDILLLDADLEPAAGTIESLSEIDLVAVDRDELADNEGRLREIFALLTQAHYRTRPADLRYLLDAPNLEIHCACFQGQLAGVVLVSVEGGLSATAARKVWSNRSRPRGHLFAELIAAQSGFYQGAQQTTARIVRIAVRPEYRRCGIGSALIEQVPDRFRKLDSLSTSFAASTALIRFWSKNSFTPVRIGFSRSANTGAPSCALMRPLSKRGQQLAGRVQDKFRKNLPIQLKTLYRHTEPALIMAIYQSLPDKSSHPAPTSDELTDLVGFGFAHHNMDNIANALCGFCQHLLAADSRMPEIDSTLLIERVLQAKPWRQCRSLAPPRGKKQGKARLRAIIRAGLIQHFPDQTDHIRRAYHLLD